MAAEAYGTQIHEGLICGLKPSELPQNPRSPSILGTFTMKLLPFLIALIALTGCSRPIKIDGEIFATPQGKGIVKLPGTAIVFLLPAEKAELDKMAVPWRERQYANEQKSIDDATIEGQSLLESQKKKEAKLKETEVISKLEYLTNSISLSKARIEQKIFDRKYPIGEEAVRAFFSNRKSVTADSDGKFSIMLTVGQEYWVVAMTYAPFSREWCFRYVPDGTKLVVSDSNAL